MALTTYSGLVSALQAEAFGNTQFTAAVAGLCIEQGENRLRRRLRTRQMLQRASFVVGSDTDDSDDAALFGLPDDFLSIRSVELTIEDQDEPASLIYLDPIDLAAKAAGNDDRDTPTHFTISDGEGRLWPVPDVEYTVGAYYYASPEALSDANESNIFCTRYGDALFRGACVHMAAFLRDWADAERYKLAFDEAIAEIEAEEARDMALTAGSQRQARLRTDLAIRQGGLNAGSYNIETDV